jgi:TrpR family transcriptional regulator, trp operon repressor
MSSIKNIKEISRILAGIDDAGLIEGFLKEILTKSELRSVAARWDIVKLLSRGTTQRKIARDLHLSLCNITRGSRELHRKNSAIKKIIRLKI